jgi:multiple sugar transport system substrate-binding protein
MIKMSKTMSRRNFLKAAALTGAGAALAACTPKAVATPTTAPSSGTPASTMEGELRVLALQGPPVTPVCNQIGAIVTSKYPKLTIKYELYPGDVAVLYTQAAAGTLSDVFFNSDGNIVPFANNNVTLDLKPLAIADKEFNLDDIFPSMLGLGTFNGKVMMFPEALDVVTMYYNKDLLTKAGAAMPTADWTWDDFITNMEKVVAISKNAQGVPDFWGIDNQTWSWWATVIPWIYGYGGKVWDPATKKSTWSDPKTLQGLTAYADMWKKVGQPLGTDVGGQSFMLGKAAVWTHIEGVRSSVRTAGKAVPFDWDVQIMPKMPDGKHHTGMGCWGLSVYAKSKMQPAAYEFAKTLVTPAMQRALAQQELAVPLVKSVANDPSWMQGLPTPPTNLMAFVSGADDADLPPVDFPAACGSVYQGIVSTEYIAALEAVLRGTKTVDQAFKDADTTIQPCLDKG